jgi:hypothetical protein
MTERERTIYRMKAGKHRTYEDHVDSVRKSRNIISKKDAARLFHLDLEHTGCGRNHKLSQILEPVPPQWVRLPPLDLAHSIWNMGRPPQDRMKSLKEVVEHLRATQKPSPHATIAAEIETGVDSAASTVKLELEKLPGVQSGISEWNKRKHGSNDTNRGNLTTGNTAQPNIPSSEPLDTASQILHNLDVAEDNDINDAQARLSAEEKLKRAMDELQIERQRVIDRDADIMELTARIDLLKNELESAYPHNLDETKKKNDDNAAQPLLSTEEKVEQAMNELQFERQRAIDRNAYIMELKCSCQSA